MLTQVGKYQIIEKIGVGGFGTVYKGRDPFIKRAVAIKTCQSDEEEIKKRFFREAEFAGNLHHRNITTIYDFGVTDEGVPYIVQEFLTGEDLDKKIKRKEPLTLARKIRILLDICDGLGYAHTAGIIHRDIKPSNVRILDDETVKLMDFGIAKSMVSESTLTQTGITLGTASYLAPEQIRGEPIDPRTDIFSLGVLMYELFTSQKPFTGDHISTVLYKILNEAPPKPSLVDPQIAPALDGIVLKSIEKDRSNRFASCAEIRKQLFDAADQISDISQSIVASPSPPESEQTIATPTGGFPSSPTGVVPRGATAVTPSMPSGITMTGGGAPPTAPRPGTTGPPYVTPQGPPPRGVAEVRIRNEAATTTTGFTDSGEEGSGALKIFLSALVLLVVVGGGFGYYYSSTPEGAAKMKVLFGTSSDAPRPTAPATASTTPTPAPTAAPVPTPTPEPQPTAVEMGTAEFSSTAYADVTVDGKKLGGVPPSRSLSLKPGKHVAIFEARGFPQPMTKDFVVKPGERENVRAVFQDRGKLLIYVTPSDAEIFIDGKLKGKTSWEETLFEGTYKVEARAPGFETATELVTVPANDKTVRKIVLRRAE